MRFRFLLIVVAVLAVSIPSAGAHADVRFRAPTPNETVGGTVDHIDLQFWAPIASGSIELVGPDGPIEVGEATLSPSGTINSVDFDPLEVEGTYTVTHTELAEDGDTQTATYDFVFDRSSSERLDSLIERGSGPNWVVLGAIAAAVLVAGFIFWPSRK